MALQLFPCCPRDRKNIRKNKTYALRCLLLRLAELLEETEGLALEATLQLTAGTARHESKEL